MSTIKWIHSL